MVDGTDFRTDLVIQECQSPEVNLVAGCGDDVLRHQRLAVAGLIGKLKTDAVTLNVCSSDGDAEEEWDFTDDLVPYEPSRSWTQVLLDKIQAKSLRQAVE